MDDLQKHSQDNNGSLIDSALVPGGYLACYADGDQEIIDANQYVVELFECDSLDDLKGYTAATFPAILLESGIQSLEGSVWLQSQRAGGISHASFRGRTKSGRLIVIETFARVVHESGNRPVCHIFMVELGRGGNVDYLTGLYGFEEFNYAADAEAARQFACGERPALMVLDLMGMRSFNASYGFEVGDRVISALAEIMRHHFGIDLCCRFAGDGFCAIANSRVVEHEIAQVFREYDAADIDGKPPIMAGAYTMEAGESLTLGFDRAKIASESTHVGPESHFVWFTNEMRDEAILRSHLLDGFDEAIDSGRIWPSHHPIMRSTTGALCAEAVRVFWDDPTYGRLSQERFLPLLEEEGLRPRLDEYIVTRVASDIALRLKEGRPVVPCTVSLSVDRRDLGDMLARVADTYGVPHLFLNAEFSGLNVSDMADLLKEVTSSLHWRGFGVWMGDVGGEAAPWKVLEGFDLDLIRIGTSPTRDTDVERRQIVGEGIVHAAKRLGIKTLAESVATQDVADEMRAIGCDMLEGCAFIVPGGLNEDVRALDVEGVSIEPAEEMAYWDEIGLVSLADLTPRLSNVEEGAPNAELPAGVMEIRAGGAHILRATDALVKILAKRGREERFSQLVGTNSPFVLDPYILDAVERCNESRTWEVVSGIVDGEMGHQFYIMWLTSCKEADAYLITSNRSTFGSALGRYGDVPVAYAILRMSFDRCGAIDDAEYVFANDLYAKWSGFGERNFIGKSIVDIAGTEAPLWLELCARAQERGKGVHDVIFSDASGHWISYNITPSGYAGHCIIAFTLADAEATEREELMQMVMVDPLTGLKNRRGIDAEIGRHLEECPGDECVLILLDIDDFKGVNDLYGHDVGDEALRTLARTLEAVFPKGAVIGRNGGDEMLVVLFGDDAARVKDHMDALMAAEIAFTFHGQVHTITLSAGYATHEARDEIMASYARADEALYAAKLAGKHCYRAWESSISEAPQRSMLAVTTHDLQDSIPVPIVAYRPSGQVLYANEEFAVLLGYEGPDALLSRIDSTLAKVIVQDQWEAFLSRAEEAAHTARAGDVFSMVCEVRTASGATFEASMRARLTMSETKGMIFFAHVSRK